MRLTLNKSTDIHSNHKKLRTHLHQMRSKMNKNRRILEFFSCLAEKLLLRWVIGNLKYLESACEVGFEL